MSKFEGLSECPEEVDVLLCALNDATRREALHHLEENPLPIALADFARALASNPCQDGATPSAQQVQVSLYHRHIPKLADIDVVTFDADQKTVGKGPNFSQALAVTKTIP